MREHEGPFASATAVVWFVVVFCFGATHGFAQTSPKFTTQAIAGYQTVRGTTTKVDELTQLNQTLTDLSQPFGDLSVNSLACLGCSGIDGDGIHLVTTADGLTSQVMATVGLADFAFEGHAFSADWLMNTATASCPAAPGGTATVSAAPSVNWVLVDNVALLSPPDPPPNPVTDVICWNLDTLQRLPSAVPVPNSICVNQILDSSTSVIAGSITSASLVITSATGDQAVVAVAHAEVAECTTSPQVALPAVDPAAVKIGSHPMITVSASISYPDNQPVIPSSVKLLQIDQNGQATILTTLNDNGTDGDAVAGDSIFSGRVQLHAAPVGLIRLQVSADFSNTPGTVLSPIAIVEVFPPQAPLTVQPSKLEQCVNSSGGGQFIANELLMFFEPGTDYSIVSQRASSVNGTIVGLQSFDTFNIWQVRIPCSTASCVEAAVNALQDDPNILRAEPNFCTDALGVTPNDPLFGQQYGPEIIGADKAWAITKGNLVSQRASFPIIGIVDTGIDNTHPEFAGRIVKAKNYTDVMFIDDCGHGTAVAGVAGATGNNRTDIAGISWYAQLVDLKVGRLRVDPLTGIAECKGTTLAGAAAIREATTKGATVINYSMGNKKRNKAEAEAIDYVNKEDRLLVSAAGNDNSNVKFYPAGFGRRQECFGIIGFRDCYNATNVSVGATDSGDMRWVDAANGGGSNYGDWVLFYAPGANILTTRVGGGTRMASGTSFAAPHVAGTASLAKASDPSRSMFSVYLRLGDDQVGNDPNGNAMARINAFKTVLAVSAKNCGKCPGEPTVKVNPRDATVNMGTPNASRDKNQAVSVHGVSIPLDAAASYEVRFDANLSTWDSCSAMQGFRDCFSISVSAKPFWMVTRDDRSPTLNPNLSVGFLYGGQVRGSQELQSLITAQQLANMRSLGADNFLNVVLDTAAGSNPDNAFPSWGTIRIRDITPR